MGLGPRVILKEKGPEPNSFGVSRKYLAAFCIYNPLRNDVYNLDIICAPDECIDGHWLVWKADKLRNGCTSPKEVIGVASHRDEIKEKTYGLAKRFAQDRAKEEVYGWYNDKKGVPFVDETSYAKESQISSVQS